MKAGIKLETKNSTGSEMFSWHNRYSVASACLLALGSLIGLLDFVFRDNNQRSISSVFLSLALAVGAVWAYQTDWKSVRNAWRIVPALGFLSAVLASLFWADSAANGYSAIGLALSTLLVLCYIGFVFRPGAALAFSPLAIGMVFVANSLEPSRVGRVLAIGVIAAAGVGELVAFLSQRIDSASFKASQHSERLSSFEDVLRRFRRPTSLAGAARQVAYAASEIFEAERSTVVLRNTDGKFETATVGPAASDDPNPKTAALVVEAIGGDRPKIIPSDEERLLVLPLPAADLPVGAVVVQPVFLENEELTLDIAKLFSTQIGIAIEHLFVINELEHATTRDALTGIGNRKHADALLQSLQEGDALILLDLDGFKEVNDTLGHAAGDVVLQDLSTHLRDCLRDSDTSARLGGDEFLVVARRAFADPAAVAHRILKGWANGGRSTTISAGVAVHEYESAASETLERADQALYKAKSAGKNRAQMWINGSDRHLEGAE